MRNGLPHLWISCFLLVGGGSALIAPSAQATVEVAISDNAVLGKPDELAFSAADYEAMNTRAWSAVRSRVNPGQRHTVLRSFAAQLEIRPDPKTLRACRPARKPGFRTVDRNTVACREDLFDRLDFNGSQLADLLCIIDPLDVKYVEKVHTHGSGGDDSITGGAASADELSGEHGSDVIRGSEGDDMLNGFLFPNDDYGLVPAPGDRDYLYGELGDDRLWGGPETDHIVGGRGRDFLCGADAEPAAEDENDDFPPAVCSDDGFRDRANRIYSAEQFGLNLDTSGLAPTGAELDTVECGGLGTFATLTQYDRNLDVMVRCPTVANQMFQPPQMTSSHPTPGPVRAPTCPDAKGRPVR